MDFLSFNQYGVHFSCIYMRVQIVSWAHHAFTLLDHWYWYKYEELAQGSYNAEECSTLYWIDPGSQSCHISERFGKSNQQENMLRGNFVFYNQLFSWYVLVSFHKAFVYFFLIRKIISKYIWNQRHNMQCSSTSRGRLSLFNLNLTDRQAFPIWQFVNWKLFCDCSCQRKRDSLNTFELS